MSRYHQKDPYFSSPDNQREINEQLGYVTPNGQSSGIRKFTPGVPATSTPATATPASVPGFIPGFGPYKSNLSSSPSSAKSLPNTLHAPHTQHVPSPQFRQGEFSPMSPEYLENPLANVAVQYGSKLVGTGKQMMDKEINRIIQYPVLKQYFSVDTTYVRNKLHLVLFPFLHSDWSLKYVENVRVGPRYDVNSPDLYIPLMAYLTYVLIAGMLLGINDRFGPESLGIIASQALAWTIVEIVFQLVTTYFVGINLNINTFDILAYSGYKFIGMSIIILSGMAPTNLIYWLCFLYSSISMGYFTVKALKWRLMADLQDYGVQQCGLEYKRKQYFLVALALSHVFQMWWLSSSLLKQIA